MKESRLKQLKRIEAVLRMQETIAIIERIDAEKRVSNIAKNQDLIVQGEPSIFAQMSAGMYAKIATYSMVESVSSERNIASKQQAELQKLRGMRKALERLAKVGENDEVLANNEKTMQEIGGRTPYRQKT